VNRKLNVTHDGLPLAIQAQWSVQKLAKIYGVSPRTLQRRFQELHGQSPEAWLAELRWRQAPELLKEGFHIKEIAAQLGYRHASTFSHEFKKRFDTPPPPGLYKHRQPRDLQVKLTQLSR